METFARIDSVNSYADVPVVPKGALYVASLPGRWVSPASIALHQNLDAFARAIEPSALLVFSDDRVHDLASRINASAGHMPILLITAIHPSDWTTLGADERFIQLRLGKFNGTAEAVKYLQRLSSVIADFPEHEKLTSISWAHRRQQVARISKKIPVLDLAGLAL